MANSLSAEKLDTFFKTVLDIAGFAESDNAMNGIQVDNDGSEIRKIAFSVDASLETCKRAAACGAGMLFVHHGLFWGKPLRVAGNHRLRLKFLLEHNICLYAAHLPLDQAPKVGNNAVLAHLLGLENIEPFGTYHGKKIGYKGTFPRPLAINDAVKKISFMDRPLLGVYPFGKTESVTCAVISGGAAAEALQAIEEHVDMYVTGEPSHEVYNECLEGKLNMIAGGHYNTEVWGVRELMKYCAGELNIDTEFIDVPTGL
ncbi:MAG: Nif3-like dinuclear metal center hexameric protein [Treponema sp.]|nr:Nif3-like dinuclear metal center hexameric protein [Treponema sp.]